jgi:hypothetical protein
MIRQSITVGWTFLLLVGFASCSGGESNEIDENAKSKDAQTTSTTSEDDEFLGIDNVVLDLKKVQFFMPEEVKMLQKYTSDSVIFFMDLGIVNYFELNSDTAFLSNLIELESLMKQFVEDVQNCPTPPYQTKGLYYSEEIEEEFGFLQFAIPFFINTCVAECTQYSVAWNLNEIKERVQKTVGTLDDDFVELLLMAHGEIMGVEGVFLSWFYQTWDYGGASLLGDKSMYSFLKKVKQFEAKTTLGKDWLNKYRLDILAVALHGCYEKKAVQIVEEIKLITTEQLLDDDAITTLKKLAEIIKSGDLSCPFCHFKTIQLNCEEGECNYGG